MAIKHKTKAVFTALFKVVGLSEMFYFSGLGLIAFGTWKLSPPAALIVCGAIILTTSVYPWIRKPKGK